MDLMTESKAKFYASKDKHGKISKELDVFYNPVMKFNRDISILLLNNVGVKNFQIADIMAGSGVRSIRFLLELKKSIIKNITVNDYDKDFIGLIKKNLKASHVAKNKKLFLSSKDANMLLIESKGFDYIDIDPFGSPNDFLELSAVRLSRGGILAVTATDTAPLSGTFPDACQRKYWAKPLRNSLMHEIGLRILIRKVQMISAQHDKALVPIYSYFKDHYNRIFFKCVKSKLEVDKLFAQHKYFLYCDKCMTFLISEYNYLRCEKCNLVMTYAGPLWSGKLYDKQLAEKIFKSNKHKKNERFLEVIMQESVLDDPKFIGFYEIHELCKCYKKVIPNFDVLMPKIKDLGYKVSRTHFTPLGIKTNMPIDELLKVIELSTGKKITEDVINNSES